MMNSPTPELGGGEGRDASSPAEPGTSRQVSGFLLNIDVFVRRLEARALALELECGEPIRDLPDCDPVARPEEWR